MHKQTTSDSSHPKPVRRKNAVLTIGTLLLLAPCTLPAAPRTAEFQEWQSQQSSQYQTWLSAQDQAFAEGLRKDWEAFLLQQPQVRDAAPKPVTPPVASSPAPPLIAPAPIIMPPRPAPATPPVAPPPLLPVVLPPVALPAALPDGSKRYTLTTG